MTPDQQKYCTTQALRTAQQVGITLKVNLEDVIKGMIQGLTNSLVAQAPARACKHEKLVQESGEDFIRCADCRVRVEIS